MRVVVPGHLYELHSFEADGNPPQTIQFIEKLPTAGGAPGELYTLNNGTTNEEVMKMLIDRLQFLHAKLPSKESACAITHIEEALMWLEKRTAARKARSVEGTNLP
jgi:hypothetical protein